MTPAITPANWAEFIRREYLDGFVREGGAAIKFCVPLDDTSRAATASALSSIGQELGFLVIEIDAAEVKINLVDRLFFAAARQINWSGLAESVMMRLCERKGYKLPDSSGEPFYVRVATKNEVSPDLVRMDLRPALDQEVFKRQELDKDFRIAMTQLCRALLSSAEEGAAIVRAITDWLTGTNQSVGSVKPYMIFNRITRTNGRGMFESLVRWVTIAGYPGLLVLMDLARIAVARNPHDEKPYYTSANLLEVFEVLREFIDSIDRLSHCMIAVLPDVSFLDEDLTGRGMKRYWALNNRISDEVRARELVNPMAALVRLSVSAPDVPSTVMQQVVSVVDCRAVEALRSGVPNEYAVRMMGSNQDRVERLFSEKLSEVPDYLAAGKQVPGLLVSGDFGTGKSHLLEYLEDKAHSVGFVCSRVVISKETPLFDPAKLYRAALEAAVVPGQAGQPMQEMAMRLRDTDQYARFYRWCNSEAAGVSALFPATLFLHERLKNDPELVEAIVNFWSGEHLTLSKVRDGLRLLDAASLFRIRTVPARRLPLERFMFTARMVSGAGYKGWLLLIDEVELISQYSFLQRARSYAELARWMGALESPRYPGILTVATITEDFDPKVLEGKRDFAELKPKLEARGREEYSALAASAEAGMRLIRRGGAVLEPPSTETLDRTYQRLKALHASAYGWTPPDIGAATPSMMTRMRAHVRRWINEWDLNRLYPDVRVSIEERELSPNYVEEPELETPPEASDGDQTT